LGILMQDQPANTMSKESKGSPTDSVRIEDDVVVTDTFAWNTAGSARVSRGADEGLQILDQKSSSHIKTSFAHPFVTLLPWSTVLIAAQTYFAILDSYCLLEPPLHRAVLAELSPKVT